MARPSDQKKQDLTSLLSELSDELDEERLAEMPPTQRVLEDLSKEILRLERDMTIPGSPLPDATRVERLMRFIEDREF